MKKFSFLPVAGALLLSVFLCNAQNCTRMENYYTCNGIGEVPHPRDCTSYVRCNNVGMAWECTCAPCDRQSWECTEQGRLVYNATQNRCLPAYETGCNGRPPVTTRRPRKGKGDAAALHGGFLMLLFAGISALTV